MVHPEINGPSFHHNHGGSSNALRSLRPTYRRTRRRHAELDPEGLVPGRLLFEANIALFSRKKWQFSWDIETPLSFSNGSEHHGGPGATTTPMTWRCCGGADRGMGPGKVGYLMLIDWYESSNQLVPGSKVRFPQLWDARGGCQGARAASCPTFEWSPGSRTRWQTCKPWQVLADDFHGNVSPCKQSAGMKHEQLHVLSRQVATGNWWFPPEGLP